MLAIGIKCKVRRIIYVMQHLMPAPELQHYVSTIFLRSDGEDRKANPFKLIMKKIHRAK